MSVDLSRNTAIQIASVTSSESLALGLTVWRSAPIIPVRGTSSGFLLTSTQTSLDIPYPHDNYGFLVGWACTAMSTAAMKGCILTVNSGTEWQSALGNLDIQFSDTSSGTNSTAGLFKRYLIGPLESARFVRSAASSNAGATVGDPAVNFELSTAGITAALGTRECFKAHIQPFQMPVVSYDT